MDNNALVPESLSLNAEPIQEIEQQAIIVAEEADKELGALVGSRGWQRLVTEMKTDIESFKTGAFIGKPEEKTLEEVGKLFVIHQTVATFLQKYLDKVENSAKAVADAERAKQPK